MAANSPFLRPLAIAAGGLGFVQALTWGILSLLGILLYTGDIEWHEYFRVTDRFENALVLMYFVPSWTPFEHMSSGTVVYWTSTYFATSVIWLVISGFLLYQSYNYMLTSKVVVGWVAVSGIVAAIDLAGTVAFGVDHYRVQRGIGNHIWWSYGVEYLLAPIFMMIMCARGFILWIINVALVIYLGVAERKLYKKGSPNLLQDPEYSSHHHGRQNTAFQPDATYGWNTQSPTVGNQQPSQRDFPQRNSFHPHGVVNPTQPIHHAGTTFPNTVVPLRKHQPAHPPPARSQKHKPNMYEARPRSDQMQMSSEGQSYF